MTAWDLWSVLRDTCTGSTVRFWKSTFTLDSAAEVERRTENICVSESRPERPRPPFLHEPDTSLKHLSPRRRIQSGLNLECLAAS